MTASGPTAVLLIPRCSPVSGVIMCLGTDVSQAQPLPAGGISGQSRELL